MKSHHVGFIFNILVRDPTGKNYEAFREMVVNALEFRMAHLGGICL